MNDQSQVPPEELDLEAACLSLIASAGEAQTLVNQALARALSGNLLEAEATLAQAEERLREAHHVQFTELIAREARGEQVPVRLLVVHGMDLLATAAGQRELVSIFVHAQLQQSQVKQSEGGTDEP